MNLIEELSNLDLSGRQAKVYLALLQLGSASAIELAKNTGFKHPTVYDVLDSLKARGLVSESFLGKKKRFTAENPDNFQEIEERRRRTLDSTLPSLKELYLGGVQRPRIRFYQGAEGIKAVNEELLNVKSKEYFYFGSVQEMFKTSGEQYLRDYFKRRIERGIWSNAIRNPSRERDEDYMQPGEHNLRRVRYLPTPISEDIAGLYLYDEKIAIHSALKENYAVTIESRELFILLKTIWQCLWNVAVEPGAPPKAENAGGKK